MKDPKKTTTALYTAAGILLLLAIVIGAYKLGTREPVAPSDNALLANAEANSESHALTDDSALGNETANPVSAAGTDGTEGREEAAMAAAIEYQPDLSYRVDGHARDWSEVNVYAGREEGKWTKIQRFRWEGGRYVYVGETAFPGTESKPAKKPAATKSAPPAGDQPLTEEDLRSIPREFRPGESTLLEAALMDHEDWVGKVQTHSKDWTSATVWIGPPQSEFVAELKLKWNRKGEYYDVVEEKGIPGPG